MVGSRTASTGGTRLNPEPNGSGRERVAGFQRARLLAAITEIAAERGVATVTVAQVVSRAGVSRRTFYELFRDGEECFLAALDMAIGQASQHMGAVYDPSARWTQRIRTALVALLSFLDDNAGMARLMLLASPAAGPRALDRRNRVLAQITAIVDEGRAEAKTVQPPPLTAEGIVGGVLSILQTRLANHDPLPLTELANHLTGMIVLPYRGAPAARAELAREAPVANAPTVRTAGENPLKALHMRLTYRTVRVLTAIAAQPGSSNRRLAEAAEIVDQGQMSKLLARLEKLELVENKGAGAARGEPNSWRLTPRGQEVQDAVTVHA
jgi:AcrR family transcriptional regulator/DNA-binding MarR family transcriptional regulator